jgi:uncharacterized damage-inducible protein DinB
MSHSKEEEPAMQSAAVALSIAIQNAAKVTLLFTEDLHPQEYLHRPCPGANCTAWILGHLVMTSRSMMTAVGQSGLPALPDGFEKRYARDESAPRAGEYGDVTGLRGLFQQHHDLFVATVAALTDAKLSTPLAKPHPMFRTLGELAAFAPTHISTHAGQITTIRRSLGRPPII